MPTLPTQTSTFLIALLATAFGGDAHSQSTQPDPKYNDIGNSFLNGMEQARQRQIQEEQLRMQREQAAASTALIAEQRRAIQLENERRELELQRQQTAQTPSPPVDPYTAAIMGRWAQNASARSGLFLDFDQVVFASDVAISMDMVELMADSKYAADIAYYLGKNKVRTYEIASMSHLQKAAALAEIEELVQKNPLIN